MTKEEALDALGRARVELERAWGNYDCSLLDARRYGATYREMAGATNISLSTLHGSVRHAEEGDKRRRRNDRRWA